MKKKTATNQTAHLQTLTHTLNFTLLYVTVSTLNPTVGIVVTDWPSFILYNKAGEWLRFNKKSA